MNVMEQRQIKPVENNGEKQLTYAKQLGRYKLAMRNEFYFEAMMIVYAMLEDRLLSFLYYAGALANRNDIKISKKTKACLVDIVAQHEQNENKVTIGTKNITGKMKMVKAMLTWASESEKAEEKYLVLLKALLEGSDIGGMLDTLELLEPWLKYRNEIIHASMNKNIDSLYEQLGAKVEEGMGYARFIDEQVRILKRDNRVRKKMNMGNQ